MLHLHMSHMAHPVKAATRLDSYMQRQQRHPSVAVLGSNANEPRLAALGYIFFLGCWVRAQAVHQALLGWSQPQDQCAVSQLPHTICKQTTDGGSTLRCKIRQEYEAG